MYRSHQESRPGGFLIKITRKDEQPGGKLPDELLCSQLIQPIKTPLVKRKAKGRLQPPLFLFAQAKARATQL